MKCIYELMLENYTRKTCLFQSPRSGKFVSDQQDRAYYNGFNKKFQSPRSGKFVFNVKLEKLTIQTIRVSIPQIGEICIRFVHCGDPDEEGQMFQSPRSGKFVSNASVIVSVSAQRDLSMGFNPLDRGNLYLIFF